MRVEVVEKVPLRAARLHRHRELGHRRLPLRPGERPVLGRLGQRRWSWCIEALAAREMRQCGGYEWVLLHLHLLLGRDLSAQRGALPLLASRSSDDSWREASTQNGGRGLAHLHRSLGRTSSAVPPVVGKKEASASRGSLLLRRLALRLLLILALRSGRLRLGLEWPLPLVGGRGQG